MANLIEQNVTLIVNKIHLSTSKEADSINPNVKITNIKLDDVIGFNSAASNTPSPSPVLCSPGKVRVLSKNLKKMNLGTDACKSIYRTVPPVKTHFKVIRKIGSGTFSNVYLATLRALGDQSPHFALKHIFSTSHPKRISNEIKCLSEIGGNEYVIGIESCIRYKGEVVIVMPYQKHNDFLDLLNKMTLEDVRLYMRQLLTALFHVHKHGVIHRDVKPNNFLFDLDSKQSGLVDFGLAQFLPSQEVGTRHNSISQATVKPKAFRSLPQTRKNHFSTDANASPPRAKRRCLSEIQLNTVPMRSAKKPLFTDKKSLIVNSRKVRRFSQSCYSENVSLPKSRSSTGEKLKFMTLTSTDSLLDRSSLSSRRCSTVTVADVFPSIRKYNRVRSGSNHRNQLKMKSEEKTCNCFGKLSVCYKCLARPSANASRAGTAGYRPPEVLLRYPDQTTAVDIWSAGVIFLSLLCGRCPFFRPSEDVDSLAQLVMLFGSKKIQEVAKVLGRRLTCSQHFVGYQLRGIVMALKQSSSKEGPKLRNSPKRRGLVQGESPRKLDNLHEAIAAGFEAIDIPDSAFDLLDRMLDPNPRSRITALKALYHDFLITDEKKIFVSPKKLSV